MTVLRAHASFGIGLQDILTIELALDGDSVRHQDALEVLISGGKMTPMPNDAAVPYPSEWDPEWVAIDRYGRIGVFTTGGAGPVPRAYLKTPGLLEAVGKAVWDMPERTESLLLAQMPRPDDYEAFARRGLFAFDWRDVHRTTNRSKLYEIQARPAAPIAFDEAEWPAELRPLLGTLRSASLDFEQSTVDVGEFDCEQRP